MNTDSFGSPKHRGKTLCLILAGKEFMKIMSRDLQIHREGHKPRFGKWARTRGDAKWPRQHSDYTRELVWQPLNKGATVHPSHCCCHQLLCKWIHCCPALSRHDFSVQSPGCTCPIGQAIPLCPILGMVG